MHAFTDLNWARWESLKGVRYNDLGQAKWGLETPMPAGLTELNSGNIYDEDPRRTGNPKGSVTPADVLNIFTMPLGGYTYDYRPNTDPTKPNYEDRVLLGAPVPEPATRSLVLLGLAALLPHRRCSTVIWRRAHQPTTAVSRHLDFHYRDWPLLGSGVGVGLKSGSS